MRRLAHLTLLISLLLLWTMPAHAERRVALVLGNGAYKTAPLFPPPLAFALRLVVV